MQLPATIAAYMAGIIDGEGCIYVNRRKISLLSNRQTPGYGVKLVISITNPEIVEWFKIHVQLTSVFYRETHGNRKDCYMCTWNNSAAESLLLAVLPYLVIKAKQAVLGLELLKHLRTSKVRGGLGHKVSTTDIEYRESIKTRIGELNKRGIY